MIVLGSTGSIGVNALYLAKENKLKIEALSCGGNISLLNEQIKLFKPDFVCVKNKADVKKIKNIKKENIFCSELGLLDMIQACKSKQVLNAIVGFAGLRPSVFSQKLGKELILANKESLVAGGQFLDCTKIRPIDSEHCALNQLMKARKNIKKLYITASGGAVYKYKIKDLSSLSPSQVLKHPNWSMGAKITIDSATMVNKLFELLEAYHLYGTKNLDAIIEPSSIVHALCEFKDGGISAYLSKPDMKLSISQAIFKNNNKLFIKELDLLNLNAIKFDKIQLLKYPLFELKDELLQKPFLGVILNAANESLVTSFLAGKIGFLDIYKNIFKVLAAHDNLHAQNLDELFMIDKNIRLYTEAL